MDSATDMDFWGGYVLPGVIIVLQIVAIIAPLMICVAYLTLAERKVIASMPVSYTHLTLPTMCVV